MVHDRTEVLYTATIAEFEQYERYRATLRSKTASQLSKNEALRGMARWREMHKAGERGDNGSGSIGR